MNTVIVGILWVNVWLVWICLIGISIPGMAPASNYQTMYVSYPFITAAIENFVYLFIFLLLMFTRILGVHIFLQRQLAGTFFLEKGDAISIEVFTPTEVSYLGTGLLSCRRVESQPTTYLFDTTNKGHLHHTPFYELKAFHPPL